MPFRYNRLYALLAIRGLKTRDLREMTGLSAPTMAKLAKGEPVNTAVLAKICGALNCGIEDIMEYVPEDQTLPPGLIRVIEED